MPPLKSEKILPVAVAATLATSAIVVVLGKSEEGLPAAPINSTSHIVFGDEAHTQDGLSAKYTGTGFVINAMAMVSWAIVQELVFGRWVRKGDASRALAAGVATSAVAYVTDYHVVPERLTPGFEKRMSGRAMGITYSVLALALAGGLLIGKSRETP